MLGDYYWVYILAAAIVVAGSIGVAVMLKIRKAKLSAPLQVPIAINPQLLDYVAKARARGMGDDQIKAALLQTGWSAKDIDLALKTK